MSYFSSLHVLQLVGADLGCIKNFKIPPHTPSMFFQQKILDMDIVASLLPSKAFRIFTYRSISSIIACAVGFDLISMCFSPDFFVIRS